MTQVGSLDVRIGVNATDFNSGIKGAADRLKDMETATDRLGRRMSAFGSRLTEIGKRLAIGFTAATAAAAAGMTAMVRATLANVDEQAKLADRVGATIDGLRGLQIAGQDAGISADNMATAVGNLNRRLAEAQRGTGTARDAIAQLGLSVEDFTGLDADQRIALIADRVKELGLDAGQTADILRQFGIRNQEMINLIRGGGDAIRAARQEVDDFGLSLSRTDAKAIEDANDSMSRLGRVAEVVSTRFTVALAPALKHAADWFNELIRQNNGFRDAAERASVTAIQWIGRFLQVSGSAIRFLEENPLVGPMGLMGLLLFGKAGGAVLGAAGWLIERVRRMWGAETDAILEDLRKVNAEVEDLGRQIDSIGQAGGDPSALIEMQAAARAHRDELARVLRTQHEMEGSLEDLVSLAEEAERKVSGFGHGLERFGDSLVNFTWPGSDGDDSVPTVEDITAPYVDAAEHMGEIEDRMAERHREMVAARLERIRTSLLSEQDLEREALAEKIATLQEGIDEQLITEEEFYATREELYAQHNERMAELARRQHDDKLAQLQEGEAAVARAMEAETRLREQATQNAINLLSVFGRESKAAAIAAIALSKGLMIAQTVQSTLAAEMRALAELGPIAGPPMAAKIKAWGMANVAAIAATGLAQATMGARSAASGGGGRGAAAAPVAAPAAASPGQVVTIQGFSPSDFISGEAVIRAIEEAQERGATLRFAL